MTYFVLKCGRVFNALLGVMASFIVSVLFSQLNGWLYGGLLLCFISMALMIYLIGFCDVFDHKAYALKSGKNPDVDIDTAAYRSTLMARNKMKSLNEQDKVMKRYRWIICGAFILAVISLLSAAVCARYGWKEEQDIQNDELIESVRVIVDEKNNETFEGIKTQLDAARDSLNQSIKLIPFQEKQHK